jgi:hypothetical protein
MKFAMHFFLDHVQSITKREETNTALTESQKWSHTMVTTRLRYPLLDNNRGTP